MGEVVLQQLEPEVQQYYLSLAKVFNAINGSKNHPRDTFINLSSWPDEIRKTSLAQLFKQFDTRLPRVLGSFAKESSNRWHYHNAVSTEDDQRCAFTNGGQLYEVMPLIDRALRNPESPAQEVLLLAFAMHFMQDIHQPLHTFTRLNTACKSDLGGNRVCLKPIFAGRCPMSLHYLWDSGFGVFYDKDDLSSLAPNIFDALDNQSSEQQRFKFVPASWGRESFKYYVDVYQYRRKNYEDNAKDIVEERVGKAISRQVQYLNRHYKMRVGKDG